MRQTLYFIITFLFCLSANGQDANVLFEATKGKWTFPLSNVQVIDTMTNDCLGGRHSSFDLTLKTDCSQEVRAIWSGDVKAIFEINNVYTVIVKSGEYLLVYTGLGRPSLKKNKKIVGGTVLGNLTKVNNDKTYELNLMLFKGEKTLNIKSWFDWAAAHNTALALWRLKKFNSAFNK